MPLHVLGERYTTIDGARTRFTVDGNGPPIVLLHGIPGGLLDWQALREPLAQRGRLYAFDLPGFGLTDIPPDFEPDAPSLAAFALSFLDAMGVGEPAWVVGHSNGGAVAQALAVSATERVSRLTLVSSIGYPAPAPGVGLLGNRAVRGLITGAHRTAPGAVLRAVLRQVLLRNHRYRTTVGSRELDQAIATLARPGALDWLLRATAAIDPAFHQRNAARIRVPTLIVHGEADRVVPVRIARNLHRDIPGSRLVILGRAGHLVHLEDATELVRLMDQFVSHEVPTADDAEPHV